MLSIRDTGNGKILVPKGEKGLFRITGEVEDKIIYPNGKIEVREYNNLIVDGMLHVITSVLSNDPTYNTGKMYWAFGSGDSNWDNIGYEPVRSAKKLYNEVYRKEVTSANRVFVNSNNEISETPTNRLMVTIALDGDEAVGHTLREFGIFGANATGTKDSGIMMNHKIHSRIDKEEGMIIERSLRFTFNNTGN